MQQSTTSFFTKSLLTCENISAMRIFFFIISFLISYTCEAQPATRADFQDIKASSLFYMRDGIPVMTKLYEELMEGSPYFTNDWKKAYLVLADKQIFKDISIKLNLLDNQIHYLDVRGNEMIAVPPIKEIFISDSAVEKNYRFVHHTAFSPEIKNIQAGWYLWLITGKAELYKMYFKTLNKQRLYGSATTREFIETREKYFVLFQNKFIEIKKPKDLSKIFPQNANELFVFLKKISNQLSSEDQLIQTVEFINSLK